MTADRTRTLSFNRRDDNGRRGQKGRDGREEKRESRGKRRKEEMKVPFGMVLPAKCQQLKSLSGSSQEQSRSSCSGHS